MKENSEGRGGFWWSFVFLKYQSQALVLPLAHTGAVNSKNRQRIAVK
jgi:hypothetical protein